MTSLCSFSTVWRTRSRAAPSGSRSISASRPSERSRISAPVKLACPLEDLGPVSLDPVGGADDRQFWEAMMAGRHPLGSARPPGGWPVNERSSAYRIQGITCDQIFPEPLVSRSAPEPHTPFQVPFLQQIPPTTPASILHSDIVPLNPTFS